MRQCWLADPLYPGDHVDVVLVRSSFDVHALDLQDAIDDLVALDDPLLAGVTAPRGHSELVALSSTLQREIVESGSNGSVRFRVPELVGGLVMLARPHDDLGPSGASSSSNVDRLPVHLAHDLELTSSV